MFLGSNPGINRESKGNDSKGKSPDRLSARTAIHIVRFSLRFFSTSASVAPSGSHTGGGGKSTLIFDSLHGRHEANELVTG